MRLLHTADWHLGRTLNGASFLEDQAALLRGQFLDILRDTRPDALLIAGDIFDRPIPPAEAMELLDEVLRRAILDLRVPVVLIPGNHDSPDRLRFGAALLREAGLHIAESALGLPVVLADSHGPVHILPSGYASPLLLAQLLGDRELADHDAGYGVLCRMLRGQCPGGARMVMVAHAFVAGAEETPDSERQLMVGGAKPVAPARFEGLHYVALGHLHRPQSLAGGRIRYSGSPLAYSFAEAGQAKSVTLVEMDAAGAVTTEAIPLTPARQLRRLRGTLEDLLRDPPAEGRRDWLQVTLTDPGPVWDPMARLREVWPGVIELDFERHRYLAEPGALPCRPRGGEPLDLLAAFHAELRGADLPEAARPVALKAIARAAAQEA